MAWAFSLSPPPVRRPHTKGGLRLGSDGSGARTGPGPGWPETLAGRVSTWDFPPPPSGPRWWPLLLLVLLGLPQGEAQGPTRRQRGGQAGTALSRASAPALRLRVQGGQSSCATQGQHAVDPQSAQDPPGQTAPYRRRAACGDGVGPQRGASAATTPVSLEHPRPLSESLGSRLSPLRGHPPS